jgi:predicted nucleic acid-binding protein
MSVPSFVISGEFVANALLKGGKEKGLLERLLRSAQLEKCHLLAPALIDLEVGNAIVQHFDSAEMVQKLTQAFRDFPIERVEIESADMPHVAQIAFATKSSTYDAAYHSVAMQLQATYLATSASYVKAGKAFGSVALLADLLE